MSPEQKVRGAVVRALATVEDETLPIVTHMVLGGGGPDGPDIHLAFRDRAARLQAAANGRQERVCAAVRAAL